MVEVVVEVGVGNGGGVGGREGGESVFVQCRFTSTETYERSPRLPRSS